MSLRSLQLDRQEAELREEKRKRQAAEAEAALWEQGSMARAVRSQLLLSEVLAERETQIAERAYVAGIAAAQDGQYLAQLHETMEVSFFLSNSPCQRCRSCLQ